MTENKVTSKSETIKLRKQYVGEACEMFYHSDPLKIVRAEGQYMYDENDIKYLDCVNNVAHVGHCHPSVVKAGFEQSAILNTNSRFLHDNITRYAEKLVSLFPDPLSVCFFVNSGSEANDLAIQLARCFTGKKDVITLDHAYHGNTSTLMQVSPYKFNQPGGKGKPNWVHVASSPDVYRGKYTLKDYKDEDIGELYANDVKDVIDNATKNGRKLAAFIVETVQCCGGQIVAPSNYLRNAFRHVREAGAVCIADEVQSGFGRVGKHWWSFQLQGEDVVPDIVTLGKPMGNGHPVSAVVTTREIADSFANTGIVYFNTFGGNPVSCAIAMSVIDVIVKEDLRKHALVLGEFMLNILNQLKVSHKNIGDVRGVGLLIGIELVTDRDTKRPATDIANIVVNRLKNEHIIVSQDGPDRNVIKLKPPMVFTEENGWFFATTLDRILSQLE